MTDPDLVRVLQRQTSTPVGLIPHQTVRAGAAALEEHCRKLTSQGKKFAIADAATPDDLAAIARLTVSWPVMTGNSSIAAFYPRLWRELGWLKAGNRDRRLPGVDGPSVVLAGSCAERTIRQLEIFGESRPVLRIDLTRVETPEQTCENALAWALARIEAGPVAIATSANPEDVAAVHSKLGQRQGADLAETILAMLAARLRDSGVRRFLIAGGETSGAVIERLGINHLDVGRYKEPGISHAVTSGAVPLAFSLKSGKLGPEDMLLPMLETLKAGEI